MEHRGCIGAKHQRDVRRMRCSLALLIGILCTSISANDQLLSRADLDLSDSQGAELYLSEVSVGADAASVTLDAPVRLNPSLAIADAQVWAATIASGGRRVIYGAFSTSDTSFDDLFVVDLRIPGVAAQLNPLRINNSDAPFSFSSHPNTDRVAYTLRNGATTTDVLWVADVRLPGQASVIGPVLDGGSLISQLQVAPDGSSAVYQVQSANDATEFWLSFLDSPANGVRISPAADNSLPREIAYTEDSRQVLWRAQSAGDQAEFLYRVVIDPVSRSVSDAQRVGDPGGAPNQRVFEFEIDPSDQSRLAFRAADVGDLSPSAVFVASLDDLSDVTRLSPNPVAGAGFTNFEDVDWSAGRVVYNAAELNPVLAELFLANTATLGSSSRISAALPLAATSGSNSVAGVSHLFSSDSTDRLAIVDGDPAVNVFVLDPDNPSVVASPFALSASQTLGEPGNPVDPDAVSPVDLTNRTFSPDGAFIALHVDQLDGSGNIVSRGLQVALPNVSASASNVFMGGAPQEVFGHTWVAESAVNDSPASSIVAAVLPASRSGQTGQSVSAFVTMINDSDNMAQQCSIDLLGNIPARLTYQATNPTDNSPIGAVNVPIDIPARQSQSFIVFVQLDGEFAPQDAALAYECGNSPVTTPAAGLNTLLLSSSSTPTADIVAIALTVGGQGIVDVSAGGAAAFSVATVNVGSQDVISAEAVSTNLTLPLQLSICQTDPISGVCVNPAAPSVAPVETTIGNLQTPTFGVFVSTPAGFPTDISGNRIQVVFRDQDGAVRGQTSVAVASP